MVNINENIIIQRAAEAQIRHYLQPGKVVVVYGPRRSGKTTLLRQVRESLSKSEHILWLDGETQSTHDQLYGRSIHKLKTLVGDHTLLIIDEAQAVPDIGTTLKILVDNVPEIKVIASGSATFDLAQRVGEPLVGRKWTVRLYPFWFKEIRNHFGAITAQEVLPDLLVYGSYPALFHYQSHGERREYLEQLVDSYLYRDILELDSVRGSKKIRSLLQMLALQVGQEVSHHELATALEMGTQTIARYLDLLEQSFIILNVRGFSRNLRKEITQTSRYYFYDNGVRNALISNFNAADSTVRNDLGALWENWLVMERIKKQSHTALHSNNYFWRTYDQKEIDWVEERGGVLYGYEFSWQDKRMKKATREEFLKTYPRSKLAVVSSDNYLEFVV